MRNEGITGGEIVVNNSKKTISEMKLNGSIVWPTSYRAVLVPTWGVCGGNYTTATVPASGGYAAVSWQLRIYRGSQSSPVYTDTVTPTTVQISDSANFSYSSGRLTASNRGKNGLTGSSGTTRPQNAAARTCYITYAVKSVTYDGKTMSAVFYSENEFGMTQLANNFSWGEGGYRNVQVTLGGYTDQNSPASAGENTTTVSAKCQFWQNAVFSSGETYEYQEEVTTQSLFSFTSTSSWISFPSSGTVKIASRGHDEGALRPGSVTATIQGVSGSQQLWQAANVKTLKTAEETTITKIALNAIQGPISVLGATLTFSGKIVTGSRKAAVYSWSSGAADTGGEVTDLANTAITPDSIGWSKNNSSYTWPSGNSYTVAHNKHTLNSVAWKFKGAYQGCTNCDALELTQSADSKTTTTGDSNYGVKFQVGTNTIGPAGGAAAIICEAWHYHGTTVTWDSDGEVIAAESSNTKVSDSFTISKVGGSDTYFSINNAQTSVSHTRNMQDNETTDTVTYRLTHNSDNTKYEELTFSATNAKDGDPSYTEWADVGGRINESSSSANSDYKLTALSSNKYSSSGSPCPFGGGSAQLSWTADHLVTTTTTWQQKQERTKSQLYTSGYTKTTTEERYDDRSSVSTARQNDTPTFSKNQSWASVSNAGAVTINANTGSARNVTITATNGTATKTVKLYQAKKVAISVDKSSLTFGASGGTETFVVTYQNTTFTVAHSGTTDPVTGLSANSGGNASGSGTKTITVTVGQNSGTSSKTGKITVTPAEAGLSAIEIDLAQAAAVIEGNLIGSVAAWWDGNERIRYSWSIQNTGSASKSLSGIMLYVYSTPDGDGDPDESNHSVLVSSVNLGNLTVPGNDSSTEQSGSITGYTRNMILVYWVKLVATNLECNWNQFEENV
ncbi:MAG: BACON domain-containing protein [Bacteroidales bacterium]|nr:BACON domain-containing protein [Bacteroidales bacterium]